MKLSCAVSTVSTLWMNLTHLHPQENYEDVSSSVILEGLLWHLHFSTVQYMVCSTYMLEGYCLCILVPSFSIIGCGISV